MGTTLDALNEGSLAYKLVIAIEGYPHLISDGLEDDVQGAWSGTDWAGNQVIGGLYAQLRRQQELHPWDPFTRGGDLFFRVMDSQEDRFGVDTHRADFGAETEVVGDCLANDTIITVQSTAQFAPSGEAYCGGECFRYEGKTDTTFYGCTRGLYSPFQRGGGDGRMGRPHRVFSDPLGVQLRPLVTEIPRPTTWPGRWIGMWLHRIRGGALDPLDEAHLVFAGRVVGIKDHEGGFTEVECKHVLDYLRDAPVGQAMWTAKVKPGVYLEPGLTIDFGDWTDYPGSALNAAFPLLVVPGPPSGPNEIREGFYSRDEIYAALNAWLGAELAANRIVGSYAWTMAANAANETRTYCSWSIQGDGPRVVRWEMIFSADKIPTFLGLGSGTTYSDQRTIRSPTTGGWPPGTVFDFIGAEEPYELYLPPSGPFSAVTRLQVTAGRGVFVGQVDLPASLSPLVIDPTKAGVFVIDGRYLVFAHLTAGTTSYLSEVWSLGSVAQFSSLPPLPGNLFQRRVSEGGDIDIKQLFMYETAVSKFLSRVIHSTASQPGTNYNHYTHDVYGHALGLAIPGGLASRLDASLAALPGAQTPILVVVDEPTKFSQLVDADLVLRWAFFRWRHGLEVSTWRIPTVGSADGVLDEGNKAAPTGHRDNHRTTSRLDYEWQKSIVKVDYNRDLTDVRSSKYLSSITFVDRTAVDDAGGDAAVYTIAAANVYGQFASSGAGLEQLAPGFLALLPLFSRAMRRSTRSIDSRLWESLSIGDVVLVADNYARDPGTGRRRVVARPAIITRHAYRPGGAEPGGARPSSMVGDVDLLFLDINRVVPYAPAGEVLDYKDSSKTLTLAPHACSEATEPVDATYFPPGSRIRVIERDPADPANPQLWNDLVVLQAGDSLQLDAGLAGYEAAKSYRVVNRDYADAATAQLDRCYQASATSGTVQGIRAPFCYGAELAAVPWTAAAPSDPVELIPDAAWSDGAGRDVGHEQALARLANNILDYKTAISAPVLYDSIAAKKSVGGTWELVAIEPIWLTEEALSFGSIMRRELWVAPWMRAFAAGTARVRVTLARAIPTASTRVDVDRGTVISDAVFSTSSTDWGQPDPQPLDMRVKAGGHAWLLVECDDNAMTRGLSHCQEGPRIQ